MPLLNSSSSSSAPASASASAHPLLLDRSLAASSWGGPRSPLAVRGLAVAFALAVAANAALVVLVVVQLAAFREPATTAVALWLCFALALPHFCFGVASLVRRRSAWALRIFAACNVTTAVIDGCTVFNSCVTLLFLYDDPRHTDTVPMLVRLAALAAGALAVKLALFVAAARLRIEQERLGDACSLE